MASLLGQTISLATQDGPMDAYEVGEPRDARALGVVLLMDAGGVRDAVRSLADRFAAAGHRVIAPNLFHRQGPFAPFDMRTTFSDPPERERVMSMLRAIKADEVEHDVRACIERLRHDGSAPGGVGLVGYCFGGRMALLMSARMPEHVIAVAPIHAGGLVTKQPDSPHLLAPKIRARLYVGVADHDPSCTEADVDALRAALEAAHVKHEIELYREKKHGFALDDTHAYDSDASERHLARVLELFARR